MNCPSIFKFLLILKIVLFFTFQVMAQREGGDSLSIKNQDSLFRKLPVKELFISRKDTLYLEKDTLVIIKDLLIREKDTLVQFLKPEIKDGMIIYLESQEIIPKIDTVILRQDTVRTKNEIVLKEIQEFSEKKNFFSRLLKNFLVFENSEEQKSEAAPPVVKSDERYQRYENKIIRKIDIRVLGVFGPSVDEPDKRPRGFLEKSGNALHIKSQKWMVRKRLLFSKGEKVNSLALSETERLLRSTSYAYDAKVVLVDYEGKDSVDIIVLVQDVWNISVGGGFDQKTGSKGFFIQDANFAGLGQSLLTDFTFNSRYPKGMNFYGNYNVNTFRKGLINTNISYRYGFGLNNFTAGINRDFQTASVKWLGGVNVSIFEWWPYNLPFDSFTVNQRIKINIEDVWIGYAFPFLNQNQEQGSRLILAARAVRYEYNNVPEIKKGKYFTYYSSDNVFTSLTYINRRFYKDRYIFRLGRTEDIPIGELISLTGGLKRRDGHILPYGGVNFTRADYVKKIGYMSFTVGYGSFWRANKMEEGVLLGRLLHFTPLIKFKNWRYRHYMSFRYIEGLNQLEGNYININKENGLRGFNSEGVLGTRKFVLNFESNFYPPLNLLGFKMAFVLFADFAWIGNTDRLISKENYFSGFGMGLRFRNEHLVFNMIQIMVGYYPDASKLNKTPLQFYERTRFFYNFLEFNHSRPGQEPYI